MDNRELDIVKELSAVFTLICDDYAGDYSMEFIQGSPVFYVKLMLWFIEKPLIVAVDESKVGPLTVEEIRTSVVEWINKKYSEILKEVK